MVWDKCLGFGFKNNPHTRVLNLQRPSSGLASNLLFWWGTKRKQPQKAMYWIHHFDVENEGYRQEKSNLNDDPIMVKKQKGENRNWQREVHFPHCLFSHNFFNRIFIFSPLLLVTVTSQVTSQCSTILNNSIVIVVVVFQISLLFVSIFVKLIVV